MRVCWMITIELFPPKCVEATRMITGRLFIRMNGNNMRIKIQIAEDVPMNSVSTKWPIGFKVIG